VSLYKLTSVKNVKITALVAVRKLKVKVILWSELNAGNELKVLVLVVLMGLLSEMN
jgi:hypothetical protein